MITSASIALLSLPQVSALVCTWIYFSRPGQAASFLDNIDHVELISTSSYVVAWESSEQPPSPTHSDKFDKFGSSSTKFGALFSSFMSTLQPMALGYSADKLIPVIHLHARKQYSLTAIMS